MERMGAVHLAGEGALPRVALVGFDESVVADLAALGGAVSSFEDSDEFGELGEHFDIVVAKGRLELADAWVHVLVAGDAVSDTIDGVARVSSLALVEVASVEVSEDLPECFREAVAGLMVHFGEPPWWVPGLLFGERSRPTPLISGGSATIAGLYDRSEGHLDDPGVGLAIPNQTDVVVWYRAFLQYLHEVDPARVPMSPPRVSRPLEWRTPEELEIEAQVRKIDAEITELVQWRNEALESLARASTDAEVGERSVLWADGDDLVGSVRMILEELGFVVDEVEGPGREQLVVTSPDDAAWTAIAEVGGYAQAPAAADLRMLNKHRMAHIAATGSEPNQTWWIVNDHQTLDPSGRPPLSEVIASQSALFDVVSFTARDLFRMFRDVRMERVDAGAARKQVADAEPGVFSYDEAPTD
jgi:hypothetical protein